MMRRRRSQTKLATEDIVRTLCRPGRDAQAMRPDFADRASICGRLDVAYTDSLHHVNDDGCFISCWVELRNDMLVLVESSPLKPGRSPFKPKTVTFATKVSPPAASFLSTPETKMIAAKLSKRLYLAVYGTGAKPCIWLSFPDMQELSRWLQVRRSVPDRPCASVCPRATCPSRPPLDFR